MKGMRLAKEGLSGNLTWLARGGTWVRGTEKGRRYKIIIVLIPFYFCHTIDDFNHNIIHKNRHSPLDRA